VAKVHVAEGDTIRQGDLLATLDTADIETQIAQAESALRVAQINLQKAQKPLSKDELTLAKANLEKARINLQNAQREYDKIAWRSDAGRYPQAASLETATVDYQSALANYNIQVKGASAEDLALLKEQVKQAEISLASAKRALEDATLTAPLDGIVLTVDVKTGEFTTGGQPAVVIADLASLEVEVSIDETEIGRIAPGQEVVLTLDAYPNTRITGVVKDIALAPTIDQGVINYDVTIALDPCDLEVKTGMTANAEIVVAQREDVLLVPNRAIRIQNGQKQVQVWRNGQVEWAPIETGLSNDAETEVLRGLSEGDLVVTKVTATNNPLSGGFGPFGR
jgi:RND family efflux transporter MFP subunit